MRAVVEVENILNYMYAIYINPHPGGIEFNFGVNKSTHVLSLEKNRYTLKDPHSLK